MVGYYTVVTHKFQSFVYYLNCDFAGSRFTRPPACSSWMISNQRNLRFHADFLIHYRERPRALGPNYNISNDTPLKRLLFRFYHIVFSTKTDILKYANFQLSRGYKEDEPVLIIKCTFRPLHHVRL